MKKVSLLAAAMTLCATSIAHAEDCAPTPPPGCPKAFQGFFLGGNIGYGVGKSKQTYHRYGGQPANQVNVDIIETNKLGTDGVVGGIGGGYQHRLGFISHALRNWGTGIEFIANWANVSGKERVTDNGGPYSSLYKARMKNSLELRGNLFYVICEKVAPKVFLGWKNAKWTQTTTAYANPTWPSNAVSAKGSKRHNGFLWGTGVDFLMSRHVIMGFEYAGTAFNKKSTQGSNGLGDNLRTTLKPQLHVFSLTAKVIY